MTTLPDKHENAIVTFNALEKKNLTTTRRTPTRATNILSNPSERAITTTIRTRMGSGGDNIQAMDHLAATQVAKPDPSDKIFVAAIVIFVLLLSALCAGIPNPEPYDQTGNEAQLAINNGDNCWVLTCAALVLLMTPGVSFFYGGMVHTKNILSTMYQQFVGMGLITLLWTWLGFSLAFGDDANGSGVFGHPKTYYFYNNVGANPHPNPLVAPTISLSAFSMFQLMFAIITPVLISGSMAERVNFNAWMLFICIWHLVVYCPLAHMAWHPDGAFRRWGVIDFAGGTVVEMNSGWASLAAAFFLGPRKSVTANSNANIPFVFLGTAMFWFGWLGFNAGSALSAGSLASQAFVTTNAAAASAMVTWIFADKLMGRLPSLVGACNGAVVGLVAITPGCGYVTVGSALVIGSLACIICYGAGIIFHERTGIDDSLDVFTVHGLGGTVGFLCTGIFCSIHVNPAGADGLIYGQGLTLAKHIAVELAIIPGILISTYIICWIVNLIIPMRVSEEEEHLGLDISMHNETVHTAKEEQLRVNLVDPVKSYPPIGLTSSQTSDRDDLEGNNATIAQPRISVGAAAGAGGGVGIDSRSYGDIEMRQGMSIPVGSAVDHIPHPEQQQSQMDDRWQPPAAASANRGIIMMQAPPV